MHLFGDEEIEAAVQVLSGRRLFRYDSEGEAVAFERELAARIGVPQALLVSSGTAALVCALAGLGIGPGDEVILPAYGYVADPLAVLAVGAVPVVCEIDDTLTIDVADLERKIGPRTAAIVPIHVNGFPCNMDAVIAIAARRGVHVVEDVCQAMGGCWRGRPLGAFGAAGVFSFNQYKILTAGEGGALVTADRATFERAFIEHDGSCGHGGPRLREPLYAGLAFRATEITAAILRVQLRKLDRILAGLRRCRDEIVATMEEGAGGVSRAPSHDRDGECGSIVAYRFPDADAAGEFCRLARAAGVEAFRGHRFLHSYPEWRFLFSRRGAHHPARNPIADRSYDPSACPATARILSETALMACRLDLPPAAVAALPAIARSVTAPLRCPS
ncbi:MAG: DegT/DnrJ/EryC1/StrS family aminotransferase [Vicinamibacterales bacterium]